MHPVHHAAASVKRWGGKAEDYLPLHDFLDSSKASLCDFRHRAILHHAFGIFILERVFGHAITNSDGVVVPVRLIGEQHVIEDLGFVPSVEQWLRELKAPKWAHGNNLNKEDKEDKETHDAS